jgi:hypothetical protein
MAQLTTPRLTMATRGTQAIPRVSVRVVLEAEDELPGRCRNGCLAVLCELREFDRTGAWIHRPLHTFADVVLHGEDFEGGLVKEAVFREAFPLRDLREDLVGPDEMIAVTWLEDRTGRRPRIVDSTQSAVFTMRRR